MASSEGNLKRKSGEEAVSEVQGQNHSLKRFKGAKPQEAHTSKGMNALEIPKKEAKLLSLHTPLTLAVTWMSLP